MVDELRHRHSVKDLCKFLGVSRSGYYRYLARKNKLGKDKEFEEKILYIYRLRNKTYGYRRIQAELMRLYGLRVNHKKVLRYHAETWNSSCYSPKNAFIRIKIEIPWEGNVSQKTC